MTLSDVSRTLYFASNLTINHQYEDNAHYQYLNLCLLGMFLLIAQLVNVNFDKKNLIKILITPVINWEWQGWEGGSFGKPAIVSRHIFLVKHYGQVLSIGGGGDCRPPYFFSQERFIFLNLHIIPIKVIDRLRSPPKGLRYSLFW